MSSLRFEKSVKDNTHIAALVEKLKSKLKGFNVIDRQGELVGEVKDLVLDHNRQLHLVLSKTVNGQGYRLFLLISKLIQKVEPSTTSLFVDINKAKIDDLPEYIKLETPGMEISEVPNTPVTPTPEAETSVTTASGTQSSEAVIPSSSGSSNIQAKLDNDQKVALSKTLEVLEDDIIRLLEERLVVDSSKRKVGEVIVRKEIETRMVQVPVRREKLIVEQVSPERKQLAEIDLGLAEITTIELTETISPTTGVGSLDETTVVGEFNSPKIASLLLNAIALERRHGCKKVRVEIVVEDAERQKTYQEWFDRCSLKKG